MENWLNGNHLKSLFDNCKTLCRCHTFLWPPYGIGQAIIFLPCGFCFFFFNFFPCLISAVAGWMSTILPHMMCLSANLGCRSETWCTWLAEIQDAKNQQKFTIWAPSHNFVFGLYLCN